MTYGSSLRGSEAKTMTSLSYMYVSQAYGLRADIEKWFLAFPYSSVQLNWFLENTAMRSEAIV